MDLAQLRQVGGIVPTEPVRKTVTWKRKNPETDEEETLTFDVFVKRHSFGTVQTMFDTTMGDHERNTKFIANTILLGETVETAVPLTYEDAYQLKTGLAYAFIDAINEVNRTAKDDGKN